MSSAILYVAIVAIWVGVLVPRWLRRGSSDAPADQDGGEFSTAEPTAEADAMAAGAAAWDRPEERVPVPATDSAQVSAPAEQVPARQRRSRRAAGPEAAVRSDESARSDEPARRGDGDQQRSRVLSARRRLLWLLLALLIGSVGLDVTRMAAWWVVAPPSVMMLGYLAMLREAAKADAERARAAAYATATAYATAPGYAAPGWARRAAEAGRGRAGMAPRRVTPVAPAAPLPATPPPAAEIIDISASLSQVGEEFYDQYADAKLRAVGDLAHLLAR